MSQAAQAMREKLFTMRMSEEEASRLEAVAAHYALNAAGVIRMLVKREFDRVGAEAAPQPARPKTKKKA
jgi:hypothetical protein